MQQPTLFDNPTKHEIRRRRFVKFHAENPHVYYELRRLALEAVNRGRQRIGMRMLVERVRWELFITTTGTDFKINNDYTPFYARLLMESEPELRGVFETRGGQR